MGNGAAASVNGCAALFLQRRESACCRDHPSHFACIFVVFPVNFSIIMMQHIAHNVCVLRIIGEGQKTF